MSRSCLEIALLLGLALSSCLGGDPEGLSAAADPSERDLLVGADASREVGHDLLDGGEPPDASPSTGCDGEACQHGGPDAIRPASRDLGAEQDGQALRDLEARQDVDGAPDAAVRPDTSESWPDVARPNDQGRPPGPDPCEAIPGVQYHSISVPGPPTDRPPPAHGDLNLELRGWSAAGGVLGLVDIAGPTDLLAPKLDTFFPDDRVPAFLANYAVHHWDWGCNCRGGPIPEPEVTLVAFGTQQGEALELPDSGYRIGEDLQALVLYVADETITLKYTREDNVVFGYTIHVWGLCVEPSLRAFYERLDLAGRGELPALRGNQPFGRARGAEVLVTIRDTGTFMDPRSRKDWWSRP